MIDCLTVPLDVAAPEVEVEEYHDAIELEPFGFGAAVRFDMVFGPKSIC